MLRELNPVLTKEEKINLLTLAMKADGLNGKLVANGIIGEQFKIAAETYVEGQNKAVPPDFLTGFALDAVTADAGEGIKDYSKAKKMNLFFIAYAEAEFWPT